MPNSTTPPDWVVLKFGGGLITVKDKLMTARQQVIDALAGAIAIIQEAGRSPIVVHGAGSFGHIKAKRWRLHEGRIHGWAPESTDGDGITSQDEACISVHRDMLTLNARVVESLARVGLVTSVHPPRDWANGTGPGFTGEFQDFLHGEIDTIPVFFGDVVHCLDNDFGILSGDDIVLRLAMELEGVSTVVFCLGGAQGLLSSPPDDPDSELVPLWSPDMPLHGHHDKAIDVTGGIALKAARAGTIAEVVEDVWFVSGEHPNRVVEAALGGEPSGTRIVPAASRPLD